MKKLNANDAVDSSDVKIIKGEEFLSTAGVTKMIAMGAFHHPLGSTGKATSEEALSKLLNAASKKGFSRGGELKTAFALTFPPSPRAKRLADDLAACFKGMEFYEALGATVKHK